MKYIDEFRDPERVARVARAIAIATPGDRSFKFMEVCGTHTMAVARFGLRGLLPANVELISGPGCPVCVTPKEYVDHAAALAREPDVTITTFGDMMRVPGSSTDLTRLRAEGANVQVTYAAGEGVETARKLPDRKVVFLAVGFETTAPTIAATVKNAKEEGVHNFFALTAHKLIPPAMAALAGDDALALDGFLCPAHVSAVIGADAYGFIARDFGLPCAVAGFEPVDILLGIYSLVTQRREGRAEVDNRYGRVVRPHGNARARAEIADVFEVCDGRWRGLGVIPASGLELKPAYAAFDARAAIPVTPEPTIPDEGCRCGEVLTGAVSPRACPLFGTKCTPETPVGPCMVSSEGSCAAAFKYQS